MKKIDEAVDRIRILECPTGDLENRVTEILEYYGIGDRNKVNVIRDTHFDRDDSEAYRIEIMGEDEPIIVLSKSGYDDYVAKVTDVYSKS